MGWPLAFPHVLVFSLCSGILLLAALLPPAENQHAVIEVGGRALPPICMFKRNTGVDCPGCGLTRSSVALVHGRVSQSFEHHPVGPAIILYIFAQALRHGLWLWWARSRFFLDRYGVYLDRGLILLAIVLFAVWIFGLF